MSSSRLSYETFIFRPVPIATDEPVPNGDRRMFSPMTATLIFGDQAAVLVDPPMTIEQTTLVGDWVESKGKRLDHIYITHGHGDHWFGAAPLVARFPGAVVNATSGTIAMMRVHGSAEFRASLWDKQFPGQIPESPVLAVEPAGDQLELEGHALIAVEVGHSDTDDTTVLHVPDIGLVVAGDVVYNGVHQYLREAGDHGIEAWLRALDEVERLRPLHVVSGHKDARRDDSPENIDRTRRYLLDFRRVLASSSSAIELFDQMLALYPDRLNPGALWGSAVALRG